MSSVAVAVVGRPKVDDRHALEAVLLRAACIAPDGDVVEQAKSPSARGARRVMAGRGAPRKKALCRRAPPDDEVGGEHRGSRRVQRPHPRYAGTSRVSGSRCTIPFCGEALRIRFDVFERMHPGELVSSLAAGASVALEDTGHTRGDKGGTFDRGEPRRALRMMAAHVVFSRNRQ